MELLENNRFKILNTYVNALTMDETVRIVEQIITKRQFVQHVVINASKVNLIEEDPKLREIVNSCPLINADGASILWAAKKLNIPLKERVTGIDLFQNLLSLADRKKYKIFLFGAKEEVVVRVRDIILNKYKNLSIVGYRNGFFNEDDNNKIVQTIKNSGADMLFVAFSSPKKEYWINKYMKSLNVPFVMGVGGSFDVIAGVTKRAPIWMQNHGLEWLFRFVQEPIRMWKRYIVGNVKFVLLTYKYKKNWKRG